MRSRGQLKITTLGSSSWMPYAPQGVKGLHDDDDDDDCRENVQYKNFQKFFHFCCHVAKNVFK
jgi:hypothetical protein